MIQDVFSNTDSVDLLVTYQGTTISVDPGPIVIMGKEYFLREQEHFEMTPRAEDAYLTGTLVEVGSEVRLFVDEEVDNGIDSAFNFTSSDMKVLFRIFFVKVPGGSSGLDASDPITYRIVKPPTES